MTKGVCFQYSMCGTKVTSLLYCVCNIHKYYMIVYTVVHKKGATFIFSITLANIDGFS